jgi:DNA-binding IclR family transcriptional regulator
MMLADDARVILCIAFGRMAGQPEADLGPGVGAHPRAHHAATGKGLPAAPRPERAGRDPGTPDAHDIARTPRRPPALCVQSRHQSRLDWVAICEEELAGAGSIARSILCSRGSRAGAVSVTAPAHG